MEGIIVDTSSILFALSNNVDVFAMVAEKLDAKPVISKGIASELEKASKLKTVKARYAKIALQLIAKHGVKTEPASGYVDNWILSAAKDFAGVCTNDTKLRRSLRDKGITVYTVSSSGDFR